MALGGDETRIQALFSELSSEDQSLTPVFEKLWRRAKTTESAGVRGVSRSVLAIVSALLVTAAAGYFAAWSRYRTVQTPAKNTAQITPAENTAQIAPQQISTPESRQLPHADKLASAAGPVRSTSTHPKRATRPEQAQRVARQGQAERTERRQEPQRVARQQQAERVVRPRQPEPTLVARQAALLSSWRSPTETLMNSPAGMALYSLPQLNQSVNELKSFLPKNNVAIKESNQ